MPESYQGLYEYLDKRYANSVVLTFEQIESLLGRPLAEAALVDLAWWSNDAKPDPGHIQSQAWTRAGRVATPNLLAHTVRFERPQV